MATKDTGGGQQRANRSSEEVEETEVETTEASDLKERKAKLDDDVDAVLDDIDEILESDAESFVRSYIQKGGE